MSSIEKLVEQQQKEVIGRQFADAKETYKECRGILDQVVQEVSKTKTTDAALSIMVLSLEVKALAQQVLERRRRIDR